MARLVTAQRRWAAAKTGGRVSIAPDGTPAEPIRLTPEDGDVVLRQMTRDGMIFYTLHTTPGADQVRLRTGVGAVVQACAFAKHQRVRAWLTDGGPGFELLQDFRAGHRAVSITRTPER